MIECQNITQIFRSGFWLKKVTILENINFTVKKGSVFGIVGSNGAGKTTLIQILVGLRKPTRGFAKIGGLTSDRLEARARIGYLPERPYYYDHLTGEQFLHHFGVLSQMTDAKIKSRIKDCLAMVGLTEAKETILRKYSKGMLQKIGIAQAILHEPEILILDEPMSGLDVAFRDEMRALIKKLHASGCTVIFSSHAMEDIESLCDDVVMIRAGKTVEDSAPQSIKKRSRTGKAAK